MTIPEYPGLMQPVLHILEETSRDMPFGPLMRSVGARLGLTAEERAMPLPSGKDTVFANRLQWALAYLDAAAQWRSETGAIVLRAPEAMIDIPCPKPGGRNRSPREHP